MRLLPYVPARVAVAWQNASERICLPASVSLYVAAFDLYNAS
jgi:hypothetical protein